MHIQNLPRRILSRTAREMRLLRWKMSGIAARTVTTKTKQGTYRVSCSDEEIGKRLFCTHQYELELSAKVMALIREMNPTVPRGKGTIVDIGANIGVISIGMICNGLVERAVAIEPEPLNFSLLQANVRQNGFEDRVICLPYAVSDTKGKTQFELSPSNLGDHRVRSVATGAAELYDESKRQVIDVDTDTLDSIWTNVPESYAEGTLIVWMDVQGHEGRVIHGGGKVFSGNTPLCSEIWPYGIRRSGLSQVQYVDIVRTYWSHYWLLRNGRFVRYPMSIIDSVFEELGYDGDHYNILFTR